ncbi:MAG: class I SAM-dependent methyltransferase [Rhizorhabdus sp.]
MVAAALTEMHEHGRHAVRIVDADCGTGRLLLHAVRHASALGFKAIEGRGIDGSPVLVGRARSAASQLHDSAIGITFDVADMRVALRAERDFPADIVLCHGLRADDDPESLLSELSEAGDLVIADDECLSVRGHAA